MDTNQKMAVRLLALVILPGVALLWLTFADLGLGAGLDVDLLLQMLDIIMVWSLLALVFPTSRLAEPLAEVARLIDSILDRV